MMSLRASFVTASTLSLAAAVGWADPVDGIYDDLPTCDSHGLLFSTEEFGDPAVFSPDQAIAHAFTFTDLSACPLEDDPTIPNALVVITNLTGRRLGDLFYVGDPSTVFTNVDGFGDQGVFPDLVGLAFRIDAAGVNRPLVFESIAADGIFDPGETWHFIVQDYFSPLGLPPDSFTSIGYADGSVAAVETSSASVVQFVPGPGVLGTLALAGLFARRRR